MRCQFQWITFRNKKKSRNGATCRGITWPKLDASIGLMIGNNVPDAYTPFEVATGPSGSPHATRTRLGWIIWNMIRECTGTNKVVNRVRMSAIHEEEHSRLNELVEKSMNFDFPERIIDDKRENSVVDNSFLDYVNKNIHFEKDSTTFHYPSVTTM
ncbi:unnamed protein product [Mytilus coruscus]|uniref:Uncharacterized protein n=1 Tax=Mytilus coruscus TaxID=42192 RepID=A0A6J8BI17_MYTCO|nr:unnamed protein product [Mytilus coruscus]